MTTVRLARRTWLTLLLALLTLFALGPASPAQGVEAPPQLVLKIPQQPTLVSPLGVAIAADGSVWTLNGAVDHPQLMKFHPNNPGVALVVGSYGSGDGQFAEPHGLAVDSAGNVYVADLGNHRIQKFGPNGAFLAKWGSFGSGDGQFDRPSGVSVDSAGDVYVVDTNNSRVQKFHPAPAADTAPPVISAPAAVTVDATSPAGAVVHFTVTVWDAVDTSPTLVCAPASGSTFAIGTTTVTCTATDAAGNQSSKSFPVTVKGASEQLDDLIESVEGFNLEQGIANSLDSKLQNALDALAAARAGATAAACNKLDAFIAEVQAQSGKTLTVAQANELIEAANRIKAALGCP